MQTTTPNAYEQPAQRYEGTEALQYAAQHPGTELRAYTVFGMSQPITLEQAFRRAMYGGAGRLFVDVSS